MNSCILKQPGKNIASSTGTHPKHVLSLSTFGEGYTKRLCPKLSGHEVGLNSKRCQLQRCRCSDRSDAGSMQCTSIPAGCLKVTKELTDSINAGKDEPLKLMKAFEGFLNRRHFRFRDRTNFDHRHNDGFATETHNLR